MDYLPTFIALATFGGLCIGIDKLLARMDQTRRKHGLPAVPITLFGLFAAANVLFAAVFAMTGGRYAADLLGAGAVVSWAQLDTFYSIGAAFGGAILFILGTWQHRQLEGRPFVLRDEMSGLVEDLNWSARLALLTVPVLCGVVAAFVEVAGTETASSRGVWFLAGMPFLASAWLLAARSNGRMILLVPCLFFLSGFEVGAAAAFAEGRTLAEGAQLSILFAVGFMLFSSGGMLLGGMLRLLLGQGGSPRP